MSFSGKEWIWPDHNHDQVMEFARNLQVPPALASNSSDPGAETALFNSA